MRDVVKRGIDLAASIAGLILLLPLLVGIAVAIALIDGRPILFRQLRPGRHGVPFTIVKFRTMRPTRADEVAYHTDAERVTRLGRVLRATSTDELPELWNVLRGEMSLVGPRPLLMEYLPKYSAAQRRRHDVRPGITSWAAVNGRHTLRFEERLALDTWYVENRSLRLDALILLRTVVQVVRRSDVALIQTVDDIGFPLPPVGTSDPDQLDRNREVAD